MGSSYFGEPNFGNDHHQRSASSAAGSSRKSKKSSSDKPKQPQRGLGVAQLEKMILHSQMGSTTYNIPSLLHHHNPNYSNSTLTQQEDVRVQAAYNSPAASFSYMSSSSPTYAFPNHQGIMMGLSEYERANIRYGNPQADVTATRWQPSSVLESQHFAQPNFTRPFFNFQEEAVEKRRKNDQSDSRGSSSQNSDSNSNQDLDLELRLSL